MTSYGSLFAGAGGFDLGFDAAGWHNSWQVEIDPHASKVLEHWWPISTRYKDITDIHGGDLQPVDVIVGGFPCQDLSVAGNRAGLDGSRSGLFYEYSRLVKEMRHATAGTFPRWVIWENVGGALSIPGFLANVYAEWDQIGAMVQEHRFIDTGRSFGIPQRRRRILAVVGFDPRDDTESTILGDPQSLRRDTPPGSEQGERTPPVSDRSVDSSRSETLIPEFANPLIASTAMRVDAGEGTLIPVTQDHVGLRSLTTGGGKPGQGYPAALTSLGVRRLTPLECERLMGWPDGHTAPAGADTHRYKLCGNGVTAPAAEWIANRIMFAQTEEPSQIAQPRLDVNQTATKP